MPTVKPRVTITVSDDQLAEIEAYRYGNKMKNQTQAILSLVRIGLNELKKHEQACTEKFSDICDNTTLIDSDITIFQSILEQSNIIKSGYNMSQSDSVFLKSMFLALQAHFNSLHKQLSETVSITEKNHIAINGKTKQVNNINHAENTTFTVN